MKKSFRPYFRRIYAGIVTLANHRYALVTMSALCFLEAFILPLSPLILLIPMSFIPQQRIWRLALIATFSAVLGSIMGYGIGYFCMDWLEPYLKYWGYSEIFNGVKIWYHEWGVWALFVASVFPLPYKLFTITAGALAYPFWSFCMTSLVVRWLHFALVPLLVIFARGYLQKWLERKTG